MVSLEEVLQIVYDSEINLKIDWFWDGGFNVRFGDDTNGWVGEYHVSRAVELADCVIVGTLEHHADSEAASKLKALMTRDRKGFTN
jgi:hypothetical protein